jgi:hypothetical protein
MIMIKAIEKISSKKGKTGKELLALSGEPEVKNKISIKLSPYFFTIY